MAGAVDHRNAGAPRRREQLLGRRHGGPGVLTAGAGELAVDLFDRPIPTQISLVVEVDRQHGRALANVELTMVGPVDLQGLLVDDVLPAVIFEIAGHSLCST